MMLNIVFERPNTQTKNGLTKIEKARPGGWKVVRERERRGAVS